MLFVVCWLLFVVCWLLIQSSCLLLLVLFSKRRVVRGEITKPFGFEVNPFCCSQVHLTCLLDLKSCLLKSMFIALLKWWEGGCTSLLSLQRGVVV